MPLPAFIPSEKPVWCSLRGAIDWLLFDLEPLTPDVEYANLGNPEWHIPHRGFDCEIDPQTLHRAKLWLVTSLQQGRIKCWKNEDSFCPNHDIFTTIEPPRYTLMKTNIPYVGMDSSTFFNYDVWHGAVFLSVSDLKKASHEDMNASLGASRSFTPQAETVWHLSLSEAKVLLAFGDAPPDDNVLLDQDDLKALNAACHTLLRSLKSGHVKAEGKWGEERAHGWHANNIEEQEWAGHSMAWGAIPEGAWEEWGVYWHDSVLKTRQGEYIEVRLTENDVHRIAQSPKRVISLVPQQKPETIGPLPLITQSDMLPLTAATASAPTAAIPAYATKLLSIVDALRVELAASENGGLRPWTRAAIEKRAEQLGAGSGRDAIAIATVLLPDERRNSK